MKKGYLAIALICAVVGLVLLVLFLRPYFPTRQPTVPPQPASSSGQDVSAPDVQPPQEAAYASPIDFDTQQKIDPNIYAWINIPGTVVDYPVLQHPDNDAYYLDHNIYGKKVTGGALFTERAYNAKDFSDPVTIIYGHKLKSGAMFGGLQATYSDPKKFAENRTIYVWMPDRQLEYEVFAALPYDNRHILYNYDFTNTRLFRRYFESIFAIRALSANFDPDRAPTPEDHVLILSTCLRGDNTKRYLVMAKQVS